MQAPSRSSSSSSWPRLLLFAALSALALWLSACSPSLQTDQLAQVKRSAIVGYSVEVEDKAGPASIFEAVDNADNAAQRGETAISAYELLGALLTEELGWDVISYGDVISNDAYKKFYGEYESGLRETLAKLNAGLHPPGVAWGDTVGQLNHEERRALMRALGVDTLMTVSVVISVRSTLDTGAGIGAEWYGARLRLMVWSAEHEDPIWCEPGADGEPEEGALTFKTKGFKAREKVDPIFLKAVEESYYAALGRYRAEGGPRGAVPATAPHRQQQEEDGDEDEDKKVPPSDSGASEAETTSIEGADGAEGAADTSDPKDDDTEPSPTPQP